MHRQLQLQIAKLFKAAATASFFSLFHRQGASGFVSTTRVQRPSGFVRAEVNVIPFFPLALLTRRSILIATMTTPASSLSSSVSNHSLKQAIDLLDSVYSSVNSRDFPLPMSSEEAGPCARTSSNSMPQRRYLWTDSFAVLAYQTISNVFLDCGEVHEAKLYQEAVEKLIYTVHQCLGKPRSDSDEDAMRLCNTSPTGYVGLRIGKVCRQILLD